MNRLIGLCVGVWLTALMLTAEGAVILTQETWTASGTANWTITNALSASPGYGTLSNPGGYLGIAGGPTDSDPTVHEDRIGTTTNFLTGNYNSFMGSGVRVEFIQFRFNYYAPTSPVSLNAYFVNDTNVWFYPLSSLLSPGWNTYTVPLDWSIGPSAGGWYGFQAPGSFVSDLQSVDEVGIILGYYNTGFTPGGQLYGLDDFGLGVPEPETYVLLGFALLSLCITFRRQLKGAVPALQKIVSS